MMRLATTWRGRGIPVLCAVLFACLPGAAVAASKNAPGKGFQLHLVPASPNAAEPLVAVFRGNGKLKRTARYHVSFFTNPAGRSCVASAQRTIAGFITGGARVKASVAEPIADGTARWCPGRWTAQLYTLDIEGRSSPGLAQTHFTVRKDVHFPASMNQVPPTLVSLTVLDSSTLTVRAAGRPDRVLGLGGSFDGELPNPFVLNTDYAIKVTAGELHVRSLVLDPVCGAAALGLSFPLGPGASAVEIKRDGHVSMSVPLLGDARNLTVCGTGTPGTTTLQLAGMLGVTRLADTALTTTVDNLVLDNGLAASVSVDLHLQITLIDP